MTTWKYIERSEFMSIVEHVVFTSCLSSSQGLKLITAAHCADKVAYGDMKIDGVKCLWSQAFWFRPAPRKFFQNFDEAMRRKFKFSGGKSIIKILY